MEKSVGTTGGRKKKYPNSQQLQRYASEQRNRLAALPHRFSSCRPLFMSAGVSGLRPRPLWPKLKGFHSSRTIRLLEISWIRLCLFRIQLPAAPHFTDRQPSSTVSLNGTRPVLVWQATVSTRTPNGVVDPRCQPPENIFIRFNFLF